MTREGPAEGTVEGARDVRRDDSVEGARENVVLLDALEPHTMVDATLEPPPPPLPLLPHGSQPPASCCFTSVQPVLDGTPPRVGDSGSVGSR